MAELNEALGFIDTVRWEELGRRAESQDDQLTRDSHASLAFNLLDLTRDEQPSIANTTRPCLVRS